MRPGELRCHTMMTTTTTTTTTSEDILRRPVCLCICVCLLLTPFGITPQIMYTFVCIAKLLIRLRHMCVSLLAIRLSSLWRYLWYDNQFIPKARTHSRRFVGRSHSFASFLPLALDFVQLPLSIHI